ncbi:MAG: PorV/PorQ family protein [Bacteroidota bacterium]|nr:PorV/PorQ family protein [Bacteroidota bacterium]
MKTLRTYTQIIMISLSLFVCTVESFANGERAGEAGASELLINPWARSSGWAGANIAGIRGIESVYSNVAGLAFTEATELVFVQTSWLQYGSDMFNADQAVSSISSFGIAQRVGESSTLGFAIMSLNFGDIEITTVDHPEGGLGTFAPKFMNMAFSYAQTFSNSIYGGVTFKVISEQISNLSANGLALDAGIQYITGKKDNIKFGVALKNIGPKMVFKGDGLSFESQAGGTTVNDGDGYKLTINQRTAGFELPALLQIGFTYELDLNRRHKFTNAATFTSNSFQKDQYRLGCEYSYNEMLMVRAGYTYEKGIRYSQEYHEREGTESYRTTALRGPSAGITFELPIGESTFGLDYSYRHTDPFNGSHSIGARIDL